MAKSNMVVVFAHLLGRILGGLCSKQGGAPFDFCESFFHNCFRYFFGVKGGLTGGCFSSVAPLFLSGESGTVFVTYDVWSKNISQKLVKMRANG